MKMKCAVVLTYQVHIPQNDDPDPNALITSALVDFGLSTHPKMNSPKQVDFPYGTYFGECEGETTDDVMEQLRQCIKNAEKEAGVKGVCFLLVTEHTSSTRWGFHESFSFVLN